MSVKGSLKPNQNSSIIREIKRGRGGEAVPEPKREPARVNQEAFGKLIKAYIKSPLREAMLRQLSGTFF